VSKELAEFVGTGYQYAITALHALLAQALLARHQVAPAREIIIKGDRVGGASHLGGVPYLGGEVGHEKPEDF
jgi:hypothetical protein